MPLQDSALVLVTGTAAITDAGTSGTLELGNTPIQGLAVQVNWSSNADTAATLSVYIHASTATGADTTAALIAQKASISVENAGEYIVPFVAPECRSICVKFEVAGTDSTVTCTFTAYVVKNVGESWTRAVRAW
jgi:hypothetical protein